MVRTTYILNPSRSIICKCRFLFVFNLINDSYISNTGDSLFANFVNDFAGSSLYTSAIRANYVAQKRRKLHREHAQSRFADVHHVPVSVGCGAGDHLPEQVHVPEKPKRKWIGEASHERLAADAIHYQRDGQDGDRSSGLRQPGNVRRWRRSREKRLLLPDSRREVVVVCQTSAPLGTPRLFPSYILLLYIHE